jgi:hypothetical protein
MAQRLVQAESNDVPRPLFCWRRQSQIATGGGNGMDDGGGGIHQGAVPVENDEVKIFHGKVKSWKRKACLRSGLRIVSVSWTKNCGRCVFLLKNDGNAGIRKRKQGKYGKNNDFCFTKFL